MRNFFAWLTSRWSAAVLRNFRPCNSSPFQIPKKSVQSLFFLLPFCRTSKQYPLSLNHLGVFSDAVLTSPLMMGVETGSKTPPTDPTSCCRSELPQYRLNPGVFFTIWSGRLQPMTKETELCVFADAQCFSSVFFWGAFKSHSASVCSFTALVFIVCFFFSFQNAAKSRILLVHIKDLQLDFLNDHVLFGFFMNSHVSIFFSLPCASEQLIQVLLRHAE